MRIPYVIDNQNHRMADVLGGILAMHGSKSLDIATAYFNVRGFTLLQEGLQELGSFVCCWATSRGMESRSGCGLGPPRV